jgi:Ca2+-binding RTX toxin-like protein
MTSFSFDTLQTTPQTLGFAESGFITATGLLTVEFTTSVTMTSAISSLTVAGAIYSAGKAVDLTGGGRVTIGSTGMVDAEVYGIASVGVGNVFNLTNAGTISARLSAVVAFCDGFYLLNTGTLTASDDICVNLSVATSSFITNTGDIFGSNYGIKSFGTAVDHISNYGTISGPVNAIFLSNAGSRFINSGTLIGTAALNGGADYFDGSRGAQDDVFGGVGNDTVFGGVGNDGLDGGTGDDVLRGLAGDDVLGGALGQDTILGGDGDDFATGDEGHDSIAGGDGSDTIAGNEGNDTLRGGDGDDFLSANENNDLVTGGAGDDFLDGASGLDSLYGGDGEDRIFGFDGIDLLFGGDGDDILSGGTGNDTIRGGAGDDTMAGGIGADVFVFARGQGTDRVTDFVNGVDKLDLRAFDLGSLAAVKAVASPSGFGLRIDVPGEGVVFVQGLTLATLTAGDVLL